MTTPIPEAPPGNVPVIVRIILAVLCLLPLVIGLLVILVIAGAFVAGGFDFKPDEAIWMQAFLAGAGLFCLPPAIVLGIILRYARWKRAPTASLVLAIVIGGAAALASGLLQVTLSPDDSDTYVTLMMFSIGSVVVGALPPFLHWWNAREAA